MVTSNPAPHAELPPASAAGPAGQAWWRVVPFFVAVLVGAPSLTGGFVRDDHEYVRQNPDVVDAAPLSRIFGSTFAPGRPLGLYRPITTLSLRMDHLIGGGAPWVFHLTNLVLAGIAATLLAALAARAGLDRRFALLAGVVFAAHAARSEAVCWIAGRAENLLVVFALTTLLLAAGAPARWRTIGAALCALLAAWSKEQGFVLPLLVVMLPALPRRERLMRGISVSVAMLMGFVVRTLVVGGLALHAGMAVLEGRGQVDRAVVGLGLVARYVALAVCPTPLLIEYDEAIVAPAGFSAWTAAGLILVAAALFVCLRRRRFPRAALAAALFLVPLAPVLNVVVPTGAIFAERFLAWPIAGASLLAALGAARFGRRGSLALAVIAGVLGTAFALRAGEWRSERSLYDAQLRDAPAAAGSRWLVASTLLVPEGGTRPADPRDRARARQLLEDAVRLDPHHLPARLTLAIVRDQDRAATGALPSAEDLRFLAENVALGPRMPQFHGLLGFACLRVGRTAEARAAFEGELELMPTDGAAAGALAQLLAAQGDRAGAEAVRQRYQDAVDRARARAAR